MAIIKKKSWPQSFKLIKSGAKKFDVRVPFKVKKGDTLVFEEWNPRGKKCTGRSIRKKVKLVYKFSLNDFGQKREIEKRGLYIIQL